MFDVVQPLFVLIVALRYIVVAAVLRINIVLIADTALIYWEFVELFVVELVFHDHLQDALLCRVHLVLSVVDDAKNSRH